jgi:hypothetical protein
VKQELLSGRVRTAVREALTGWTLAIISDLFKAEGFIADLSYEPPVGGDRRGLVEQFYVGIDWTRWEDVRRMLRVVEGLMDLRSDLAGQSSIEGAIDEANLDLVRLLTRDGYLIDEKGSIRPEWEVLTKESVSGLPAESAIPGHLRRMWANVEDRPEQALSAAKDAVESTAKHVLTVLGVQLTGKEKFPAVVDRVQKELRLHPTTVAPDQKGADALLSLLGSLANIANKVDELRNLYGDGHGRPAKVSGLTSRHSYLVARCADAYIAMLLDTLEAPNAPWRRARVAV